MKLIKVAQTSLGQLCSIKTNFPDADFWLQRKGDVNSVGKPTKEFTPENIGVKVEATDVLDPSYLYYVFVNLHSTGRFRSLSRGMLNLQNITTRDIKNISLG